MGSLLRTGSWRVGQGDGEGRREEGVRSEADSIADQTEKDRGSENGEGAGTCETRVEPDKRQGLGHACADAGEAIEEITMSVDDHSQHDAHNRPDSGPALRVRALESLLVEKGLVDPAALDSLIDTYEHRVGPRNGARVVARAWVDPNYKKRLLTNAAAAVAELGISPALQGAHMVVLENTPRVHNMVVCTLCSCYPWPVLGLPPVWYKSAPYRARAVSDPRGVLREFGVELPANVEIRVWDSSAEMRYMVLPLRPSGTNHLSADELAALVTRDAMIGTAIVKYPHDKATTGRENVS